MTALVVERAGHATVQDLGRPGHAHYGIPANGAADQQAARTANILVGNADGAPLIEITGSSLTFGVRSTLLLAATGIDHLDVDGQRQPARQPLAVFAGARVHVPAPDGLRSYVAINGELAAERVFGSVAPDRLMGVGRQLRAGDELAIESRFDSAIAGHLPLLFRFEQPPRAKWDGRVDVTPGPDLERLVDGAGWLSARYEVSPQSDHIGLRLLGPAIEQHDRGEILSRGVPIGAVQVPPSGGVIVLLRGRMLTAGYPVIAVVTTASLDRLGQVAPGDGVTFTMRDTAEALDDLRRREAELQDLARRVRTAFTASGLPHSLRALR